MLFLTPISFLAFLIDTLIIGIISWLVLWLLMKKKLPPPPIPIIFLIVFISLIIFEGLYWVLEPIFYWAMSWHYTYYIQFQIFAVQLAVLFLYFFILFVLLFNIGRRNAIIVSTICTVTIPIFYNIGWYLVSPFILVYPTFFF